MFTFGFIACDKEYISISKDQERAILSDPGTVANFR